MPWSANDAPRHDKQANTPAKKRRWAAIANAVLRRSGDEGTAIRVANSRVEGLDEGLKRLERFQAALEKQSPTKKPWEKLPGVLARRSFKSALSQAKSGLGSASDVIAQRFTGAVAELKAARDANKPARVRTPEEMERARARGQRFMAAVKREADLDESRGARRLARQIGSSLKRAGIDLPTTEVVPQGRPGQGQLRGHEEPLRLLKDPALSARVAHHMQHRSPLPFGVPSGHPKQTSNDELARAQRQRYHNELQARRQLVSNALAIAQKRAAALGSKASARFQLLNKRPDDTHVIEPPGQPDDQAARTDQTRRLPRMSV